MRRSACLVLVLLTLPAFALATTVIHVYQGNSIQAAIDTAEAGTEQICVHPGTYPENIELLSGIDVYSSDGPDSTIISGDSTWTRTVFADQISYMHFAGFTVEGGKGYGMYSYVCSHLHCEDLVFNCDADTAALYDAHSSQSIFESITINGPSGARSGLEVGWSDEAEYDSITVRGIEKRGIFVQGAHVRCFNHFSVDSCGTGIYLLNADETTFDGGTVASCTTGLEAYTGYQQCATKLAVKNVDVLDCGTGFSTTGESNLDNVIVAIDTCTVADCTDGMILDRSWGFVKHTDFDGIDDIGITITEGERIIIGALVAAPRDSNTFANVDGVGILADSGAVVTIGKNEFTGVLGSAIIIETENDSTDVSYCEMDGSGGCYEGIATSGSGTMVRIRESDIYDYAAHQSPEPRGITVFGATAHLGQGINDNGNNSFIANGIDLSYETKAATPDTLKAEYNWWGEAPPDTSEFSGRKAYIDCNPWLTQAPGRLPASEDPCELPTTTRLTSAYPNPSAGSVRLQYWICEGGDLGLGAYDLDGRRVRTLFKGETAAGPGSVVWDGFDEAMNACPSGVYLIRMTSRSGTDTRRFVLVR